MQGDPRFNARNRRAQKGTFSGRGSLVLFSLGIVSFSAGSIVGPQFHASFLLLGYAGVALMLAVSISGLMAGHHRIIPEVRLMWLFCLWAILSGVVMARDTGLFFDGVERIFQIAVIAFCVAGASARLRSPALGLGAMLAVALLLGSYGLITGDFDSFTEVKVVNRLKTTGVRSSSMVHNANTLGVNAVWGLVAITYFTSILKRRWLRLLLWSSVPLLALSMLASGSRKAMVLPAVYLVAWIWFCHRKWLLRRWQSSVPILALVAVLMWGLPWVMENTFLGYRMHRSVDSGEMDGSTESRLKMYQEALHITAKHPIAGVGLSQWRLYATGGHAYAHNDYSEIAATTGIVGLILYLSPYLLAVRRLHFIRRTAMQEDEYNRAGVCLALLVTVAAAGFGQVLFSSQAYWGLVGSVWGYAFGCSRVFSTR